MMNGILATLGRILISVYFIIMGVATLFNWDVVVRELSGLFANWEIFTGHLEKIGPMFTSLVPMTSVILGVSVFLQIVGGLLVFFSLRVKFGAFLLLVYMVPATIIYHHFWYLEGDAFAKAFVLFLKNASIIGGLLILIAANYHKREVVVVHKKQEVRSGSGTKKDEE